MPRPRLKEKYLKEIVPELKEKLKYKSIMQVPRLEKICINQGVGRAVSDKKLIEVAIEELSAIAGQKAIAAKARKSVSNFKLREGMPIGATVTLRGNRMYEFFDRLVTFALPCERDFQGVNPKSFDQGANYNLGVKEQIIFPEISIDKINRLVGMNITFVVNTTDKQAAYLLLAALGMPFKGK